MAQIANKPPSSFFKALEIWTHRNSILGPAVRNRTPDLSCGAFWPELQRESSRGSEKPPGDPKRVQNVNKTKTLTSILDEGGGMGDGNDDGGDQGSSDGSCAKVPFDPLIASAACVTCAAVL